MFSCPVSSPFTTLHTDLWLSGHFIDRNGNIVLMNVMCDMIQFVIIVPVLDETAATLAEHFIQRVFLKLDICHLVILDDGSPFRGVITEMCRSSHINYDVLAIRNHKILLVKKFHRFINKDKTISVEGRATNDVFVAAVVAAGYAWNISPIDGAGILRSVLTIGRELRFPLDIYLSALPPIVFNNAESVVSYLRLIDSNRYFASTILKILVEDQRNIHVERINTNRNIVTILPGDLVMARTTESKVIMLTIKKPNFATQCEVPSKLFVAQVEVAISFVN